MGGKARALRGMGALGAMFGGGKPRRWAARPDGRPQQHDRLGDGARRGHGAAQFQQMVDQLTKSVREVHLTVTWKEGKLTESFDIVTHVVSLGPGSDRNGGRGRAGRQSGQNAAQATPRRTWVPQTTASPSCNPSPRPHGLGMIDRRAAPPPARPAVHTRQASMAGCPAVSTASPRSRLEPLAGRHAWRSLFNPRGRTIQ